jgi:hypothetical protein
MAFIGTTMRVVWVVAALGVPLVLATAFIAFPERIIRWHGAIYRRGFKEMLHMSDDQVDQIPLLPWDVFLVGSRSRHLNRAAEHPDEFPSAIVAMRLLGCLFGAVFVIGAAALLMFTTVKPIAGP